MSTTVAAPMSVAEARRRLSDTRSLSSEQVGELQRVVDRFLGARPRNQCCVACGSAIWSEHETAAGDAVWCCAGCHRPASLTQDEWHAQRAAAEAVRMVQEAREAAAAPPFPRDSLLEALTARQEASAHLSKPESGLEAARAALATAAARYDTAVAGMQEAEAAAVTRLAASLTGARAEAATITTGAARGGLRTAEDALSAARGARSQLDDQLLDARRATRYAEAAVRSAALRVLAAEELETLITAAVVARADYVEAIGSLAWLIRNGAIPSGDARARQLVRDADTPASRWPEAAHADGCMAERLAALMEGDHP